MIAVLCAARNSIYKSLPDVDVYDVDRDVRTFAGGVPIVAHPPCRAWSAFCRHQAKPAEGEKELAPLCVEWLRKCGGVLEHPACSRLWEELHLPGPGESRETFATIEVDQSWFGDTRTKRTWLLVAGVDINKIQTPFRLHDPRGDRNRWNRLSKTKRAATPPAMAHWLVDLAKMAL